MLLSVMPRSVTESALSLCLITLTIPVLTARICKPVGGLVAEWLACWTQAQKGLGSNRSYDVAG